MTMLDRMRRHRDWLKWSLGLVVLAFVIFYIPDFLRGNAAGAEKIRCRTSSSLALMPSRSASARAAC